MGEPDAGVSRAVSGWRAACWAAGELTFFLKTISPTHISKCEMNGLGDPGCRLGHPLGCQAGVSAVTSALSREPVA